MFQNYIESRPEATLYHSAACCRLIQKAYGHRVYSLVATVQTGATASPHDVTVHVQVGEEMAASPLPPGARVTGLLPLVHMKHPLFGNSLYSLPFFDLGGVVADNGVVEQQLLAAALRLGKQLRVDRIELRQKSPLLSYLQSSVSETASSLLEVDGSRYTVVLNREKERMVLPLPEDEEVLWKGFKSKLRSQIKRPLKEDLVVRIGGEELLDDFYRVFCVNMRDLGSPVHAKKLMRHTLLAFGDKARIFSVNKDSTPLAVSLVLSDGHLLANPWASSLREYSRMGANMLLYWEMLRYGCQQGVDSFDFGRSTPGEGTHKFKLQWGARPEPLYWYSVQLQQQQHHSSSTQKSRFGDLITLWKKLPLPVANFLGPLLRKHIGL